MINCLKDVKCNNVTKKIMPIKQKSAFRKHLCVPEFKDIKTIIKIMFLGKFCRQPESFHFHGKLFCFVSDGTHDQ